MRTLDSVNVKFFKLTVTDIGTESNINITARCPVCGDSRKSKNTKRLHLYTKDTYEMDIVSCFNGGCPVENKPMYVYLRDHFPHLLESYKQETLNDRIKDFKLSRNYSYDEEENIWATLLDVPKPKVNEDEITKKLLDNKFSKKLTTEEMIKMNNSGWFQNIEPKVLTVSESSENIQNISNDDHDFDNDFFEALSGNKTDLKIAEKYKATKTVPYVYKHFGFTKYNSRVEDFLEMRKLKPRDDFMYAPTNIEIRNTNYLTANSIVIPFTENGVPYGFYTRSLTQKSFFMITNSINDKYNLWNWFNVNHDEPVYIFEGIFDALSSGLDNVIALTRAKMNKLLISELKQPVFCLDNDKTGIETMLKYSKEYKHAKFYIQPKEIKEKDMNELLIAGYNTKNIILNNIHEPLKSMVLLSTKL